MAGPKSAAEKFDPETADEQPFLLVAQELLGPGREAAVSELKLTPCLVQGVYMEAGADVVPATGFTVRIEAEGDVREVVLQRYEYVFFEGLLSPPLFQIGDGDPQRGDPVSVAGGLLEQTEVEADLLDEDGRLEPKRPFVAMAALVPSGHTGDSSMAS